MSYPCPALVLALTVVMLAGCIQDTDVVEEPGDGGWVAPPLAPREDLGPVGSPEAFDVLTWNLENFPKRGVATLEAAAKVLDAIQPDVVAVQEVVNGEALFDLADSMPGWQADVAAFFDPTGPYNPPVGMLWNSATVDVQERYLLFEDDYEAFPRSPLVFEVLWRGVAFVIINVHLKAMGDDFINHGNPWDEEVRRLRACERLDEYLQENLRGRRVIVLGDFNDRLEEPPSTNVFMPFFDRPGAYLFADMPIAANPTRATVSYPKYGSHIDHILITDALFPSYFRGSSYTRTVAVDRSLMNSWFDYETELSDHRPVLIHLAGLGDS